MAWNEPGGNKDPWGNRRNDGPPDLDEVFRKLQDKLGGIFGGGGRSGDNSGGGPAGFNLGVGLVLTVVLIVWALSGVYIVDAGEKGVVLHFGKYVDTTQPGLRWYPRIIQSVETVNVTGIRSAESSAQVLTGDENIVQVNYTIQYNIKDAGDYLFNVNEPDLTLRQAGESAFRELIGKNTLDYVIQDGRDEVPDKVQSLLQENLDLYETGIEVITVNLIDAQPPQEVQNAFDDAIKAREDKDRFIKEAQAYRNEIIPSARGEARKRIEDAKGYKFNAIKSAEGDADRFLKLLSEYRKAPAVTRERLYLEALEEVYANSGKVMVDIEGGNNLMYLPLDKIITSGSGRVYVDPVGNQQGTSFPDRSRDGRSSGDSRNSFRSRESR